MRELFSFFLPSFLFALYYQSLWGGKPRFSPAAGTRGTLSRIANGAARDISDLKAPSGPARRDRGVVPQKAQGPGNPPGAEGPGARAGRPKERTVPEPSRSSGPRGSRAGQLLGLAALAALLASAPQDTLAASLRKKLILWTPGVGCLRPGIRLTFPGFPGQH